MEFYQSTARGRAFPCENSDQREVEEEPKSLLKMSIEGSSLSCYIANPQTIHQAENGTIKPGQHTWNGSRA